MIMRLASFMWDWRQDILRDTKKRNLLNYIKRKNFVYYLSINLSLSQIRDKDNFEIQLKHIEIIIQMSLLSYYFDYFKITPA